MKYHSLQVCGADEVETQGLIGGASCVWFMNALFI